MQPLPGKLYKIPKMKNKSFFILKKMNKKPNKKKSMFVHTFRGLHAIIITVKTPQYII